MLLLGELLTGSLYLLSFFLFKYTVLWICSVNTLIYKITLVKSVEQEGILLRRWSFLMWEIKKIAQ